MAVASGRFSRKVRLLTAAEYARVFEKPKRISDNYFTILIRPNNEDFPRLGMAVSKKNAKRAVDRNRIKRVVRESFRWQIRNLGGWDIVVLSKRQTAQTDNLRLAQSLERLWQKVGQLCVAS